MSAVLRALAGGWHIEAVPLVLALVSGGLYARGRRSRATDATGRAPRRREAAYFAIGLAAILVALLSPLDNLAAQLQWAHMAQHLLLLLIAPPLVLLGRPLQTGWRGLPPSVRAQVDRHLSVRPPRVPASGVGVVSTSVAFTATMWAWHLPRLYNATLANQGVHDLEHTTFLAAGLLFWAPIVGATLWTPALSHVGRACASFTGLITSWMLAVYIGYFPTVLYAYAGAYGVSALADQQMAAGVMWIPGSVPFLVALTALLAGWFEADDRAALTEAAQRTSAPG